MDEEDDEYEEEDEGPRLTVTNWDWSQINSSAIWARDALEVEDDEYKSFYKAFRRTGMTAWITSRRGRGRVQVHLVCPRSSPFGMYDSYHNKNAQLRLCGRYSLPMSSKIWCLAT